jgi:hypothetical protein
MGKKVSDKRLSTEDGFDGVGNYLSLDKDLRSGKGVERHHSCTPRKN